MTAAHLLRLQVEVGSKAFRQQQCALLRWSIPTDDGPSVDAGPGAHRQCFSLTLTSNSDHVCVNIFCKCKFYHTSSDVLFCKFSHRILQALTFCTIFTFINVLFLPRVFLAPISPKKNILIRLAVITDA